MIKNCLQSERLVYRSNKNQEKNKEYNKFSMENIQSRAKDQLLNIQDSDTDIQYESFNTLLPQVKKKSKNKQVKRIFSTQTSHRYIPDAENQNSKDLLKHKLKKLLQKQKQTLSPSSKSRRIKTINSLHTIKHSESAYKITKFNENQDTSRLLQKQKYPLLSLQRQNNCVSQRNINQFDTKKAFFDQQSQRIRKLIKLKIEQKAFLKNQRKIQSIPLVQRAKKLHTLMSQKIQGELTNQDGLILKNRQQNEEPKIKVAQQKISGNKRMKNKENCYIISSASILLTQRGAQNNISSRKLRNILF